MDVDGVDAILVLLKLADDYYKLENDAILKVNAYTFELMSAI